MLTARENMDEVIRGGNPDRVVNQFEAIKMLYHPFAVKSRVPRQGELNVVNAWGVTSSFPEGVPGPFPVHTPEKIVIKDIERWRDYVHAPSLEFTDEEWAQSAARYEKVDTAKAYKTVMVAPGIFEQCHYLGEISNTLMNLYEYPDEMHELIQYIKEWELQLAEGICSHLHPDAILHHDDMGSQKSSFMSPDMWAEFYVDAYKEIYGYYHDHGVKLVIHHSDSYAANLVPAMIEMGIDVWQGCFSTNNIPELIAKYGGKIAFMGGIDNRLVDREDWSEENNRAVVRKTIEECGNKYFIPCIAQGGPGSVYPGVYESLCGEIDAYNEEKFGFTPAEQAAQRLPSRRVF